MMTLRNTFHGTEYSTKKGADELASIDWRLAAGVATKADKALERKVRKALCGVKGCLCSGLFGLRE